MRQIVLIAAVFQIVSTLAFAQIIDNSNVTVFGTLDQTAYPPEHSIDDDLNSFWHGTDGIPIDTNDFLAYGFNDLYSISQIDFFNDFSNTYAMGELEIQISDDSTNGLDGTWTTVDSVTGDFTPPSGDFTRFVNIESTRWVRLFMTNQGRGTWGTSSPAFYLSEIDFYGDLYPTNPTLCDLQLDFSEETLTLSFQLASVSEVEWNVWLSFETKTTSLWSIEIPVADPPTDYDLAVASFPSVGTIGFLTTFVTEEGIVCSDWEIVDTGTPDSHVGLGTLRGLFMRQQH